MANPREIAVVHHDLMAKGWCRKSGDDRPRSAATSLPLDLLTLTQSAITELNSYYNTAVDERAIDVQQISRMVPVLYERTKRFYLLKNAVVSCLVARRVDQFDLVFSTYNELSLTDQSLQYLHQSQYRRWTTDDDSGPLSGVYDELCNAIEEFDVEMIGTNRLL